MVPERTQWPRSGRRSSCSQRGVARIDVGIVLILETERIDRTGLPFTSTGWLVLLSSRNGPGSMTS